jgi:hypothetical protein
MEERKYCNTCGWAVKSIIFAFLDIMNGIQDHEIQENTGLLQERCDEIAQIRRELLHDLGPEWRNS